MDPNDPAAPPPIPDGPPPPPYWEQEPEEAEPGDAPAGGPSWEFRAELGWAHAAWRTTAETLFHPGTTYAHARRSGDYKGPMIFAFLMGSLFLLIMDQFALLQIQATRAQMATMPPMPYQDLFIRAADDWLANASIAQSLIRVPLNAFISPLLAGAVLHLFLFVFGGANHGFEATYRASAYTFGASAPLMAIPVCGPLIGVIWGGVSIIIALARLHETDAWRTMLAVTFASIFNCCCLFGSGLMATGFQIPAAAP